MNPAQSLVEELPVLQRLALSYAPAEVRSPTLALLALDTRLAAILRATREPMLAQLRLSWWREQLGMPLASWPPGDPLLAVLRSWEGRLESLAALVDGWESMTGEAPLPGSALRELAEARGEAFAALAGLAGEDVGREAARRMGTNWALADLARRLSHPREQASALELARARDWRPARLSRRLRPLVVLHGLAKRSLRRERGERSAGDALAALRLGLLGR